MQDKRTKKKHLNINKTPNAFHTLVTRLVKGQFQIKTAIKDVIEF